jgi:PKD repeat protein
VTATDPDGEIPTLTADDLPTGSSFVDNGDGSGTFNWTPTYDQSGNYDVTFTASSGGLEDTCIVDITVNNVNRPPEITCPGEKQVFEDELLEFDVSATDPDGTTPSLSAEDLPSGADFTDNGDGTGTFSWTPGHTQEGEYDVTFIASDGDLEDDCVVHIEVFDAGPVPPNAVDDYYEVDEDSEDNVLDVLENDYDLNGDDITIIDVTDPKNGTLINHGDYITYNPFADHFGEDDFEYTISDGDLTDTAKVDIKIIGINDPPETPDAPEGPSEGKSGQTYTFTAVTTDIEGDDIAYLFDWGDGTTSGWTAFFPSGTEASATHSWVKGEYNIRVQAKDEHGDLSEWSDIKEFTSPRSRERSLNINPLINYFREGRSIIDFIRLIFSARSWITLYLLTT